MAHAGKEPAAMMNKIVIRYADKRIVKGVTVDFAPNRDIFHIAPVGSSPSDKPLEVRIPDLKAVFFVKDFAWNPKYEDKKNFEPGKPVLGRKIRVLFKDGEEMIGTTQGYQLNRPGFFMIPADSQSNVERCYVVTKATREVKFI